MESRIVLVTTGAVFTGSDQQPVDLRFLEPLSGKSYPAQRLASVKEWQELDLSGVPSPRYLIVWNFAGRDDQLYGGPAREQEIADSVLCIGLSAAERHLEIHPAKLGEPTLCGGVVLPLAPGVKVFVASRAPDLEIPVKYLVAG